ncbi:glycosyltransferase family 2 protein [uncultured Sphingomonas sp.]|uniref:glycosyltransferase family 2 protein n=1 Tax=uncultured Sphingomonas sp. TaxID=158754 RepID=UPI0035CAA990
MYLDLERHRLAESADASPAAAVRWTVLIPFFNERDYLPATIASLARQGVPFDLLLVDNGSTDDSADVARQAARAHDLAARLVTEREPGKIAALRTGLAAVHTPYVATCDADTLYPPHYLRAAERLLERDNCVAAGAFFVAPDAGGLAAGVEAAKIVAAGALMPRLCHAGGAGQCFRTDALRAAGGFDPRLWRFVLEDHEIFHRLRRFGAMRYARDLWCVPSPRERDRPSIRWTLLERLLYGFAAGRAGDWFFYRFLAGRLTRRRLASVGMRERVGQDGGGQALATAHPVR